MNKFCRRALVFSLVFLLASLGSMTSPRAQLTDQIILVPLLDINFPGWEKKTGYPKVEQGQDGNKGWIEAQNIYQKGPGTLTAVIAEGGEVAKDLAAITALPEYDNKDGFRKKLILQGMAGVESYDKAQKKGALVLNVKNRFGVRIEGTGIDNTQVLKDFANKMPLTKIWRLAQ